MKILIYIFIRAPRKAFRVIFYGWEYLHYHFFYSKPTLKADFVQRRYLVCMGDNLNDFDNLFRKKGLDDRAAAADTVKEKFGKIFIVLPNPIYGDWEGSVYKGNWKLSPKQKSEARKSSLIRWNK